MFNLLRNSFPQQLPSFYIQSYQQCTRHPFLTILLILGIFCFFSLFHHSFSIGFEVLSLCGLDLAMLEHCLCILTAQLDSLSGEMSKVIFPFVVDCPFCAVWYQYFLILFCFWGYTQQFRTWGTMQCRKRTRGFYMQHSRPLCHPSGPGSLSIFGTAITSAHASFVTIFSHSWEPFLLLKVE